MATATILKNAHPVSAFSQGKASSIFNDVADGTPALIIKNNEPYRAVITVDDYLRYEELEEDLFLLELSLERLAMNAGREGVSAADVLAEFGIAASDLDAIPDDEIEFE